MSHSAGDQPSGPQSMTGPEGKCIEIHEGEGGFRQSTALPSLNEHRPDAQSMIRVERSSSIRVSIEHFRVRCRQLTARKMRPNNDLERVWRKTETRSRYAPEEAPSFFSALPPRDQCKPRRAVAGHS
jgi:hypothetical protein